MIPSQWSALRDYRQESEPHLVFQFESLIDRAVATVIDSQGDRARAIPGTEMYDVGVGSKDWDIGVVEVSQSYRVEHLYR